MAGTIHHHHHHHHHCRHRHHHHHHDHHCRHHHHHCRHHHHFIITIIIIITITIIIITIIIIIIIIIIIAVMFKKDESGHVWSIGMPSGNLWIQWRPSLHQVRDIRDRRWGDIAGISVDKYHIYQWITKLGQPPFLFQILIGISPRKP